ncbi:MAG: DUF1178 family protein [Rhodoferax sp.]
MKVLDLQCTLGHVFEGWFASEADCVGQSERSLVQCPVCGDPAIVKKLCAPRLSLSGSRSATLKVETESQQIATTAITKRNSVDAISALARRMLAETTDVGEQFAEEARKMHYGEKKAEAIRGTATPDEAHALVEEGIEVLSFPLPPNHSGTLQ